MPLCTKCGGWIDPFPPAHVCKPKSDGDSDFDDVGEMASVIAISSMLTGRDDNNPEGN